MGKRVRVFLFHFPGRPAEWARFIHLCSKHFPYAHDGPLPLDREKANTESALGELRYSIVTWHLSWDSPGVFSAGFP